MIEPHEPRTYEETEVYDGHFAFAAMAIIFAPHQTKAVVAMATTEDGAAFAMLSTGSRHFRLGAKEAMEVANLLTDGGPFQACEACLQFHEEVATALRELSLKLRARIN